jgi:hypothetical protein
VKEPSSNPTDPKPTGGAVEPDETSTDKPGELPLPSGIMSVIAIVIAFGALMIRKD